MTYACIIGDKEDKELEKSLNVRIFLFIQVTPPPTLLLFPLLLFSLLSFSLLVCLLCIQLIVFISPLMSLMALISFLSLTNLKGKYLNIY